MMATVDQIRHSWRYAAVQRMNAVLVGQR